MLIYIYQQTMKHWVGHCRNGIGGGFQRNSGDELKLYLRRTGSTTWVKTITGLPL